MEEVRKLSCNEQPALVPSTSPEETLPQQQVDDSPNTSTKTHQLPSIPPTTNNTTTEYPKDTPTTNEETQNRVNTSISRDCALKPKVFLAQNPTLEQHSHNDQVHIYRWNGICRSGTVTADPNNACSQLTEDVLKPSDEDTTLTSDIKRKMCSVLELKYRPAALQATLAKSCLLDPRYRGNNFDEYAEEETKCALINEMLDTEDRESGASASAADQPESLAQTAVPPPTKKRTLGDLLKSRTSTSATVPKRARADLDSLPAGGTHRL
ncbi:unnamed protein product [Boreogadus saida]